MWLLSIVSALVCVLTVLGPVCCRIEEELQARLAELNTEKDGVIDSLRRLQEEHQLLMQAQCADKDLLQV